MSSVLTLRDGSKIPQLGLGTLGISNGNGIEIALKNGYRHLDLAPVYGNQPEIGQTLQKAVPGVVRRDELFITSKLWNSDHKPDCVETALNDTLQDLRLDYLDLFLMHWPVAFASGRGPFPAHPTKEGDLEIDTDTSIVDTWKAMIALPKSKVKSIGVSNFKVEHLEALIKQTGIVPVVNQIEAHPLLLQDDLVEYCKEKNIHITAYSPFGNNPRNLPRVIENPVIQDIAKKIGATPAQVLIAWGTRRGYSIIPKSDKEEHIISNMKQIDLDQNDYETICALGRDGYTRHNIPQFFRPGWNINVFNEPEEKVCKYQVKL